MRPAPGLAATSSSTPVATSSHSRAPTGSGYQMSSAWRCFSCTSSPSRHSSRLPRAARAGLRLADSLPGDSPTRDVQLVDRVERADRVAGEHVGESGREPTAGDDARAVRLGVGVEREQRPEGRVAVGRRRVRDARADGAAGQRGVGLAGQRGDDRVEVGGERIVAPELVGLGAVVQRARDLARVLEPARGDDHPVDAGGVDELAGGRGRRPRRDRRRGRCSRSRAHRKSGPCSSRQPPPLVGGTGPLLRTFTTTDTAAAIAATSNAALEGLHASASLTTVRPDGPEGVAEVPGRGAALDHRLVEAARAPEVLGHDLAVLGVGRVQPAPDRLGREAPVRERAHERPARAHDPGHVGEHLDRPHEVVDRHAAHRGVERVVGERQRPGPR